MHFIDTSEELITFQNEGLGHCSFAQGKDLPLEASMSPGQGTHAIDECSGPYFKSTPSPQYLSFIHREIGLAVEEES